MPEPWLPDIEPLGQRTLWQVEFLGKGRLRLRFLTGRVQELTAPAAVREIGALLRPIVPHPVSGVAPLPGFGIAGERSEDT